MHAKPAACWAARPTRTAHERAPRLPETIAACLFDLDGVLTRTAELHAAAWKQTFDAFLRGLASRGGGSLVPFDAVADYDTYVDGKPRADGVRSFLASRGIRLPEGSPADPPAAETVQGLGVSKNELVHELMAQRGVTRIVDPSLPSKPGEGSEGQRGSRRPRRPCPRGSRPAAEPRFRTTCSSRPRRGPTTTKAETSTRRRRTARTAQASRAPSARSAFTGSSARGRPAPDATAGRRSRARSSPHRQ